MPSKDLLSINLATLGLDADLHSAVSACSRLGIGGVGPWREQIARTGLRDARKLISDHGLRVTSLCRGGMFTARDERERRARIEENMRAIEEAQALQAECLVLVCGGLPLGSKDLLGARHMVEDGIASILDDARSAGVPLAIEPLHPMTCADRSVVSTVRQALEICHGLGDPEGLGITIDAYHVWWDPHLSLALDRAQPQQLCCLQISDWLVPTRDLVFDRGMMGDGVIDVAAIRRMVEERGYRGMHEVEILSNLDWWRRAPEEVLAICVERHERFG